MEFGCDESNPVFFFINLLILVPISVTNQAVRPWWQKDFHFLYGSVLIAIFSAEVEQKEHTKVKGKGKGRLVRAHTPHPN